MHCQVVHEEGQLLPVILSLYVFHEALEVFCVDSFVGNQRVFESSFFRHSDNSTVIACVNIYLVDNKISEPMTVSFPE